jgi:hypothetical protein
VLALTGVEDQVRQLIIGVSAGKPVRQATLQRYFETGLATGQLQPNADVANAFYRATTHDSWNVTADLVAEIRAVCLMVWGGVAL